MSGIGKPQSRCASAEPGGRPDGSMPANLQRRRVDELVPACGDAPLPGLRERLPNHSIAWGSNGWPENTKSGARDEVSQICKSGGLPTQGGGGRPRARGGLPACSCRLWSPESWAAAGGGARGERRRGWWEKARDEMSPHQPLPLICRAPQPRGGDPRFPGWARDFAAPPKIFCGPGRDAGSERAGFSAPTRGMRRLLEFALSLISCKELTMHGWVQSSHHSQPQENYRTWYEFRIRERIYSRGSAVIARSNLMHAGSFHLEEVKVDSIWAVLTVPIYSHHAASLHTLTFSFDERATTFTEEQEQALQLLTSIKHLEFHDCKNLQSQGLRDLSSLKGLRDLSSLKGLMIADCKII